MSTTVFGTCRLNSIQNDTYLNNLISYTHSTKEVIQLIQFLQGTLTIPSPYNQLCFRTAICNSNYIDLCDDYMNRFQNTDTFIIEICSRKKYMHNGFYMHHLPFDKLWHQYDNHRHAYFIENVPSDVMENYTMETQSDEEIENDIIEIQKMLSPKKIIIISHYNSKINGEYFTSRNNLICLLETICNKYNIPFINPTNILSNYRQEDVIAADLAHFTGYGIYLIRNYINNYLNTM